MDEEDDSCRDVASSFSSWPAPKKRGLCSFILFLVVSTRYYRDWDRYNFVVLYICSLNDKVFKQG